MKPISLSPRLALAAAALLAGCGGGIEIGIGDGGLGIATAQGYAADAQVTPVNAATAVETATRTLDWALSGSTAASLTLACAGGGTVAFSVSGGSFAQQRNGAMDAGETYDVSFNACAGPTAGAVLDGSLTLRVTGATATDVDLTHTARGLRLTTAQGRYTVDGSVREQRASVALAGGGRRLTSRLTGNGVGVQGVAGGRTSSYELRDLDWTVVCTLDFQGALLARSHQGTLTLAVNTPRRPAATLRVATQGSLTLGADGLASQGSFSLATDRDRVFVSYGVSDVLIELDLGNDGRIDSRWTLTRIVFHAEAG